MEQFDSIVGKKYLSTIVDRFFSRYQYEEQPNYVEFVQLWLKFAEESYVDDTGITRFSFWKTLSSLDDFIDVDRVPNEVLKIFMQHYANNFSNIFENIPFFVEWESDGFGYTERVRDEFGNLVYKYDNIRMFLKTARKFFSSKGSYYSIMYMFRLFNGSLEIVPLDRDIIKLSDRSQVLSAPNPITNRLSHLHGISPDPYIVSPTTHKLDSKGKWVPKLDWWYTYYGYKIITNLKEEFYKPLLMEVAHPAGMKCVWKEKEDTSNSIGWGYDDWGTESFGGSLSITPEPNISLSTNVIQFSNNSPNILGNWRTVEITNTGEQPLIINSIILGDDVAFELDLNDSGSAYSPIGDIFPITVNFGETVGFRVRFTPILTGYWSTLIVINSNGRDETVRNISLSGYCV